MAPLTPASGVTTVSPRPVAVAPIRMVAPRSAAGVDPAIEQVGNRNTGEMAGRSGEWHQTLGGARSAGGIGFASTAEPLAARKASARCAYRMPSPCSWAR